MDDATKQRAAAAAAESYLFMTGGDLSALNKQRRISVSPYSYHHSISGMRASYSSSDEISKSPLNKRPAGAGWLTRKASFWTSEMNKSQ